MVDSGNFPWAEHKARFAMLNEPDPSYHDVVYTEAFGRAAFIGRCRVVPLRNTGAALSPFNAFLVLQGIETLALRMERHVDNALRVARFLDGHDHVAWVKYAGLPDHPDHKLANRYLDGSTGDAKSLACHPASTTHRQLNANELAAAGVSEDMVRLSIGLEHIDDILADLSQALEASVG